MFWIALLFFLVMVGGILAAIFSENSFPGGATAAVAGVLGVVFLISSMISTVPTRNIGIVVAFGKPTDKTTGAGLQWTKPWEGVEDWDATAKAYDRSSDKNCVSVRIAGGGSGCVEVTVGWRAAVPRSPENFSAFRPEGDSSRFDVFTDRRVTKPINAEVLSLFSTFDPFQGISAENVSAGGLPPSPDLNKLYRQTLTDRLNVAIGGGELAADGKTVTVQKDNPATKKDFEDDPDADVVILSVTFGFIHYDEATTAKLQSYGQKLLENRNLQVDEANASLRKSIAGQQGLTPFEAACLAQAGAYAGLCKGGGSQVILPAK